MSVELMNLLIILVIIRVVVDLIFKFVDTCIIITNYILNKRCRIKEKNDLSFDENFDTPIIKSDGKISAVNNAPKHINQPDLSMIFKNTPVTNFGSRTNSGKKTE